LKEGNVKHELYRYQAQHAFDNEHNDSYNPEATKLAWERSLNFLSQHVK